MHDESCLPGQVDFTVIRIDDYTIFSFGITAAEHRKDLWVSEDRQFWGVLGQIEVWVSYLECAKLG
jgi:hypothetical protein